MLILHFNSRVTMVLAAVFTSTIILIGKSVHTEPFQIAAAEWFWRVLQVQVAHRAVEKDAFKFRND